MREELLPQRRGRAASEFMEPQAVGVRGRPSLDAATSRLLG